MNDQTPCRVSADLRRYEAEQDRLEADFEARRDAMEAEAVEKAEQGLSDPEVLGTVLEDELLRFPLARLMGNLDRAIKERITLDPACKNSASIEAMLQASVEIQRTLFCWLKDFEIEK